MAQRNKTSNRCPGCLMKQDLCICALAPRFELPSTRVTLLLHYREAMTTTNTGRVALLALPNSAVRPCGGKSPRIEREELFRPGEQALLLYPRPGAEELTPELARSFDGPVNLFVPDGTWTTARKIVTREPLFKEMRSVSLPAGAPSKYALRHSPHPERISTLEAIARSLEILEGRPDIRAGLEHYFEVMVERVLWTRGKLRSFELRHLKNQAT